MINPLRGLAVFLRLGPEDVGREGLRIAVVKREPARLNLRHYAVARQEDVVRRWQRESIEQRLIGFNGFSRLQALAVSPAKDVGGDHQLIAAHLWLAGDFVGINV